MKKVGICLLLVLLLVLPVSAYDKERESEAISRLEIFGLIKGNGEDLALNQYLTREQALVILTRLMGEEEQALANKEIPDFTDLPPNDWATPYIAYALNRGWIKGVSDNQFGYGRAVIAKDYTAMIYRALGRDNTVEYDLFFDHATKNGLFKGLKLKADTPLFRRQAFVMLDNALGQVPYGEEKKLIYVLGLVADETLDEEYEVWKFAPKKASEEDIIELVSLEVVGLNQLVLEFSQTVPDSIDLDNFKIKTDGSARLKGGKYHLSDNGKIVELSFSRPAKNQELVDLEIIGLLPKKKQFKNILMRDATLPSIYDATVLGYNYLRIDFTETMAKGLLDEDNYKLLRKNGEEIPIRDMKKLNNGQSVMIETGKRLERDTRLFVAGKIEDLAGIKMDRAELRLSFELNEVEPRVVDYEVISPYRVKLYLDKPVTIETNEKDFAHTSSYNYADYVKIKNDVLIIDFDRDNALEEGKTSIFISGGALRDLWGNYNMDIWYDIDVPEF